MKRSDIYLASLDPGWGSEANKTHPVVVVSHDALNQAVTELDRGVITVVSLSSNTTRIYAFQVLFPADVTGLSKDSKAQAEQARVLAFERFPAHPKSTLPGIHPAWLSATLRLH